MSEILDRYAPSELDDAIDVCLSIDVDALEAKLEAWKRTVDSYVNGDGTMSDLEYALENGPMTAADIAEVYGVG